MSSSSENDSDNSDESDAEEHIGWRMDRADTSAEQSQDQTQSDFFPAWWIQYCQVNYSLAEYYPSCLFLSTGMS